MKIVITCDKSKELANMKATVHRWWRKPVTYECLGVGRFEAQWLGPNGPLTSYNPMASKLNEAGARWQLSGFPETFTTKV